VINTVAIAITVEANPKDKAMISLVETGGNKSCDEAAGFLQHGAYAFRYVHSQAGSKSESTDIREFEEVKVADLNM
jgi:hypothetical protein